MNEYKWIELVHRDTIDEMYMYYKEEIKQIGQDTFTKHVTLFIAKFSIAKENLAMRNKIRWKYNLQKMNL